MRSPDVPVRLGDFVFEPSTGLVRSLSDPERSVRLPPKPSALLGMLIGAEGGVVAHEEIRDALWPDVHVDYDQNLRFCARQVRAAFGDSASAPRYVGTVPKRGYRLLVECGEPPDEEAPTTSPGASAPSAPSSPSRMWWAGLAAILVLAAAGLTLFWRSQGGADWDGPVRLAVVPFGAAAEGQRGDDLERLGEWLLAQFVEGRTEVLEVVGPRTTASYSGFPFPDLEALEEELDIDFVLNARPFEEDGERQLIVELIRLSDGAHPFARFYETERPWREIGSEVLLEVLEALDLPRPDQSSTP